MAKILLVEDERNLSNVIRQHLEDHGYDVQQVWDGVAAVKTAVSAPPDLIILDIMLPKLDGLEVCRQLRAKSIVPILMLTARAEEFDRVLGLEMGADDYLTKPFSMRELTARVRALLRRIEMMQSETDMETAVSIAHLNLNPTTYEATYNEQNLGLTAKEFALLHLLIQHPGRVFSRAYLLDTIWGYQDDSYDRTVDTHIYRLRQKLGTDSDAAKRLIAVRGVGYKFAKGPVK